MLKHLLLFAMVFFTTSFVNAQSTSRERGKLQHQKSVSAQKTSFEGVKNTSQSSGTISWSAEDQKIFMNSCVEALDWSQDSAKQYCSCMMEKIAKIYPNSSDANQLNEAKTLELAKQCIADMNIRSQWTKVDRKEFMDNCVPKAAESLGRQKAETYCSCALVKAEKQYPNPSDVSNVKQEQLNKWAKECLL